MVTAPTSKPTLPSLWHALSGCSHHQPAWDNVLRRGTFAARRYDALSSDRIPCRRVRVVRSVCPLAVSMRHHGMPVLATWYPPVEAGTFLNPDPRRKKSREDPHYVSRRRELGRGCWDVSLGVVLYSRVLPVYKSALPVLLAVAITWPESQLYLNRPPATSTRIREGDHTKRDHCSA